MITKEFASNKVSIKASDLLRDLQKRIDSDANSKSIDSYRSLLEHKHSFMDLENSEKDEITGYHQIVTGRITELAFNKE